MYKTKDSINLKSYGQLDEGPGSSSRLIVDLLADFPKERRPRVLELVYEQLLKPENAWGK